MLSFKRFLATSSLVVALSINSIAFAATSSLGSVSDLSFLNAAQKVAEVLAPNSGTLLNVYLLVDGRLALVNEQTKALHSIVMLPQSDGSNWIPLSYLIRLGFTPSLSETN